MPSHHGGRKAVGFSLDRVTHTSDRLGERGRRLDAWRRLGTPRSGTAGVTRGHLAASSTLVDRTAGVRIRRRIDDDRRFVTAPPVRRQ
jgi:hypothetical protein